MAHNTKVFTIHGTTSRFPKTSKKTLSESKQNDIEFLSTSRSDHVHKENEFSNITDDKETKNYYHAFYGVLDLVACIMGCFGIALIPMPNSVLHPEFWYDIILPILQFNVLLACSIVIKAELVFHCFKNNMSRPILILFCSSSVSSLSVLCLLHLIYSEVLGFNEPAPFRCLLEAVTILTTLVISLWCVVPKEMNKQKDFQRQYMAFSLFLGWFYFVSIMLVIIAKPFKETPESTQWVLGIALPMTKEITDHVGGKIVLKSVADDNVKDAMFVGKISFSMQFSIWITVLLATSATQTTGYVMLATNFAINMRLTFKAIKFKKPISSHLLSATTDFQRRDAIDELVLNEIIETLVPIAFIISYSIVFYGPNHDVIGNVGCGYWSFQKIEDLNTFLLPVMLMAFLDTASVIISGALLHIYCNTNILLEYCRVVKRYWMILAIDGAAYFLAVLKSPYSKIVRVE